MERPRFGDYFVLAEVAQGGMGTIFRAKLTSEGPKGSPGAGDQLVAIKCMHLFATHGQFDAVQAFRTEAALALQLHHPNIVRAIEIGDSQRGPYMVMEWLDGKTLREVIYRAQQLKTGFPAAFCAHVAMKAAAALAYTHEKGILHRDVSPQNIMATFNGKVKVIDFGIAKLMEGQDLTRSGVIKGKPSYLSPEQVQGVKVDARTDIFNIGIVLWEMLTQKKLFQGRTVVEIIRKISECDRLIKPPSEYNPSTSPELDEVVMRALAQNPDDRYQTADELFRALVPFAMNDKTATESQTALMRHLFAEDLQALEESRYEYEDEEEEGVDEPAAAKAAPTPLPSLARPKPAPKKDSSSPAIELEWNPAQAATPARWNQNANAPQYSPALRAVRRSPRPSSSAPKKSGKTWAEIPIQRGGGLSSLVFLGVAAAMLFLIVESKANKARAMSPVIAKPSLAISTKR